MGRLFGQVRFGSYWQYLLAVYLQYTVMSVLAEYLQYIVRCVLAVVTGRILGVYTGRAGKANVYTGIIYRQDTCRTPAVY